MNRKRNENESFEQYRNSQNKENELLKNKMKGRLIWISAEFFEKKQVDPFGMRPPINVTMRRVVQGTYIKNKSNE